MLLVKAAFEENDLSSYPTLTVQPVFDEQDHITQDYFGVLAIFLN